MCFPAGDNAGARINADSPTAGVTGGQDPPRDRFRVQGTMCHPCVPAWLDPLCPHHRILHHWPRAPSRSQIRQGGQDPTLPGSPAALGPVGSSTSEMTVVPPVVAAPFFSIMVAAPSERPVTRL